MKLSKLIKKTAIIFVLLTLIFCLAVPALADTVPATQDAEIVADENAATEQTKSNKAYAAAVVVGLAAAAGAIAMGMAICKTNESISRQPEAEGSIRSNMMLGLVFIETAIIYALIVGILIIFVL